MEKVLLPNYGFVKTKLPKNIYSSVLKECLNMKGKEEFTSGLTEPGVTKHYYVKDNLDKIQNFMSTVSAYYNEQYPRYLKSIRVLDKNLPMGFQRPWINYQKQGEHVPMHEHDGVLSYNIWMKLPTKSVFEFNYNSTIGRNLSHIIYLDKKDEGTVVLFPSLLQHIVYPFHKTTKTRISIAGNIVLKS
tara:strand:- start:1754 stop:2317 length:564 start_codon:yes stop_codon:yes gene_type:complete